MNHYRIRTMQKNELSFALQLAQLEGWNPGLYDAESFYAADPDGFFLGLRNDEPVACLSAVKYSPDFGFIGLYIVKNGYRGQGYGMQLWQTGIAYLHGCNIGLDGVVEQQANYQKSAFQFAYRNSRYQGISGGSLPTNANLIRLTQCPFNDILVYDKAFFPSAREAFLNAWLSQPESHALGIIENNQLVGYGVIRRCHLGFKIAPLFADSFGFAKQLFLGLSASVPAGEMIYLDIPETNPQALALVEQMQMQKVFETARMYTRQAPDLAMQRLYGITSFELG